MSRFTVGALVGLSMVAWVLCVIHAIGDVRTETFDREIAAIFTVVLLAVLSGLAVWWALGVRHTGDVVIAVASVSNSVKRVQLVGSFDVRWGYTDGVFGPYAMWRGGQS